MFCAVLRLDVSGLEMSLNVCANLVTLGFDVKGVSGF